MSGAKWTSNLPRFREAHAASVDAALRGAGMVVTNAVKVALRGGYRSGAFVTGASIQAVQMSEPTTEEGVRVIRVGTHLMYNLFWELGHYSAWTRKYEREEKWRPAFEATATQQSSTFAAIYTAQMKRWEASS